MPGAMSTLARPRRLAFVTVLVLALSGGCSKRESPPNEGGTGTGGTGGTTTSSALAKDPAAGKKLIAEGALVLDVRTPDEFNGDHLANAVNIPLQELTRRLDQLDELVHRDRTKPIVLYCGTGKRAAAAKRELDLAGYTDVVNGGGIDDLR